jgi:hypothetical protein
MENQQIFDYLDELLLHQTGRRLNSLQAKILKSAFTGQRYIDIAREYNCTLGHAKDEASKLWRLISKTLGEDIYKRNLIVTIERKSPKINKEWIQQ